MILADAIFILIALMTMAGALATVLARSIIYAMLGLVVTMFGIAGLYIYLNAPFIAMMQILIYVGAISILIAFAIMVAGPLSQRPKEWTTLKRFIVALVVAASSFFLFCKDCSTIKVAARHIQHLQSYHKRYRKGFLRQAHASF